MLLEIVGLVLVGVLLIISLWGLYNVPILATGVKDFRKNRQKTQKTSLSDKFLPTFSIVVPVRNEGTVIGRLLNSLSKLNYPVDKSDIIIVEDGSTDGTLDICMNYAKEHAAVKILNRSFSNGKPSALNYGLKHATGEIVAIFDADNVPISTSTHPVRHETDAGGRSDRRHPRRSSNSKENML